MTRKTGAKAALDGTPRPAAQSQPYEPTAHEQAALERLYHREKHRAPAPRYKVKNGGGKADITSEHAEPAFNLVMLADALGTGDLEFADGILNQIAKVAWTGERLTSENLNFTLAIIHGIKPRDATEALLAVQMAAIHNATIVAARRVNGAETIQHQGSAGNLLNKLTRTFANQMEALKRFRATGEQNIRVQHVTVSAGQAVVGINQGGGAPK